MAMVGSTEQFVPAQLFTDGEEILSREEQD